MINFSLYCVKLLENTSVYSAKFALSKTKFSYSKLRCTEKEFSARSYRSHLVSKEKIYEEISNYGRIHRVHGGCKCPKRTKSGSEYEIEVL